MRKEYEVVHEIFNSCSNNQMRDVYIEEMELDDAELETYIRGKHKDKELKVEREDLEDGSVMFHLDTSGILQRYTFTEI